MQYFLPKAGMRNVSWLSVKFAAIFLVFLILNQMFSPSSFAHLIREDDHKWWGRNGCIAVDVKPVCAGRAAQWTVSCLPCRPVQPIIIIFWQNENNANIFASRLLYFQIFFVCPTGSFLCANIKTLFYGRTYYLIHLQGARSGWRGERSGGGGGREEGRQQAGVRTGQARLPEEKGGFHWKDITESSNFVNNVF